MHVSAKGEVLLPVGSRPSHQSTLWTEVGLAPERSESALVAPRCAQKRPLPGHRGGSLGRGTGRGEVSFGAAGGRIGPRFGAGVFAPSFGSAGRGERSAFPPADRADPAVAAAAAVPPTGRASVPESGSIVAPAVALESVIADCPASAGAPAFRHPEPSAATIVRTTIAPTLRIRTRASFDQRSTSSAAASASTSRSLRNASIAAASSSAAQRDSATSWSCAATSPRSNSNRKKCTNL